MKVIELLQVGLSGFAFLLAFLSFKLLHKEQGIANPREQILKAINRYILLSIALAIIVGGFRLAELVFTSHYSDPISDILKKKKVVKQLESTSNKATDGYLPITKKADKKEVKKIEWRNIASISSIFASFRTEDKDKDGFIMIPKTGSYLPETVLQSNISTDDISEIKIDFDGALYSNSDGFNIGYIIIEILNETKTPHEVIIKERFDIMNGIESIGRIPKEQIYKLTHFLDNYNKIISVRRTPISNIKIFVHPGNHAIVIRDLLVKVR